MYAGQAVRETILIYQASFDHVKVGPTSVLALHSLCRQLHMFLDILEFRVENKTKRKYLERKKKKVLEFWLYGLRFV